MYKVLFLMVYSCCLLTAKAQVNIITLNSSNLLFKEQLWNVQLINPLTARDKVNMSIVVRNTQNNTLIYSIASRQFSLPVGVSLLNLNTALPLTYILNNNFGANSPNGLIPPGSYTICYTVNEIVENSANEIGQVCEDIVVTPITNLQLQNPYLKDSIPLAPFNFQWLPPQPSAALGLLQYTLTVKEQQNGQEADDAFQLNVPLLQKTFLSSPVYPVGAEVDKLAKGKSYVWQIVASSNGSVIATSDVWSFYVQSDKSAVVSDMEAAIIFIQLKEEDTRVYDLAEAVLHVNYENFRNDSSIRVVVQTEQIEKNKGEVQIGTVEQILRYGENYLTINLTHLNLARKKIYKVSFQNQNGNKNYLYIRLN
jgi:hypothetical protein